MTLFTSRRRALTGLVTMVILLAACGSGSAASSAANDHSDGHSDGHSTDHAAIAPADRAAAQLANASYQDVDAAEAAGYASTLDTLGCFESAYKGGMGVHYLNQSLMDATVDIKAPEALVYELDGHGAITGLVAHEYIVPVEAWTSPTPPSLFGVSFHRHPTLPLWVLHAWLWKDNPTGVFQDWNPAVRLCPDGVPIFGVDLPRADNAPTATDAPPATDGPPATDAAPQSGKVGATGSRRFGPQ